MDPNLLAQLHGDDWLELSALAKKNTLTPEQTTRFLELYRTASKDLSRITTVAPDSLEAARLSAIVHRSRNHLSSVLRVRLVLINTVNRQTMEHIKRTHPF